MDYVHIQSSDEHETFVRVDADTEVLAVLKGDTITVQGVVVSKHYSRVMGLGHQISHLRSVPALQQVVSQAVAIEDGFEISLSGPDNT